MPTAALNGGYFAAQISTSRDDFSTGFSTLPGLKKFDIDYIKTDQSVVFNLTRRSPVVLAKARESELLPNQPA